jgi:2-hydroxychromene-2-carboxylate isomerase
MPALEFFFDLGSPYSYLASTQVEALVARASATLKWRPFLLGGVFSATGNEPPTTNMYKARYLFKDLQDWANHYRLPPVAIPEDFPGNSLKANRLALVADEQGKLPGFVNAAYRAAFVDGQSLSDAQVLTEVCRGAALDVQASFARMLSQEVKDRLRRNTEEAVGKGAYGAPTFFIGDEMFFGNDRLLFVEAALTREKR